MLPDKCFLWPYAGDGLEECIADIRPLLERSALSWYLRDKDMPDDPLTPSGVMLRSAGDVAEYIALECRFWNVSPWWVLTRMQGEQSAIKTSSLPQHALEAVCGVVNGDGPRTKNPGFYGVFAQIQRCCEVTAWLLGVEPSNKWPENIRSRKQAPRYTLGAQAKVKKDDGTVIEVTPLSRGDWMQLQYTDWASVLRKNEGIYRELTPLKFF